ncbi:hypothetical protein OSH11_04225 [Kaistia dalseonensis]|uniref:Uncharacterized protein n=1 Tax=Kaistia dalseonensis TaxID=410840 RepID=A0ABU0H3V8_9HYPH|nr:hypothetical protein [Kaistia dalseonensis]MCX5493899.1 hypothetical protein [Kaistia dalseonensis]MDQ0436465.1 hypothetical protein [Kaistia dalseonensis]
MTTTDGTIDPDQNVDLYLSDIHNFFQTPEVDPFLGDNIEASGIDQLMDTLNARRRGHKRLSSITIHLPAAMIMADLPARTRAAIDIYCNTQIRLAVQKKREVWLEGWRALRIGSVFWIVCLGLSLLSEQLFSIHGGFGRLFSEGFIIAGWVGLWRPAELLLYEWRPYRREIELYEAIKRMQLRIVPRTDKPIGLPTPPDTMALI